MDADVVPAPILFRHPHHHALLEDVQLLKVTTRVLLPRDQLPMLGQESLRSKYLGNLLAPAQLKALRLPGEPLPLIIAKPRALLSLQFPENTNLLLKILDDVLLLPVDPACQGHQDEGANPNRRSLAETPSLDSQKSADPRLGLSLNIRRLRRV